MRQSLKTCVFVAAAASGVLGAGGGVAYADAGAGGGATNSPGVLSGNNIQVTVDTPVNVCGNSVDGGAALNPAMGDSCGERCAARGGRRTGPGRRSGTPGGTPAGPGGQAAPEHADPGVGAAGTAAGGAAPERRRSMPGGPWPIPPQGPRRGQARGSGGAGRGVGGLRAAGVHRARGAGHGGRCGRRAAGGRGAAAAPGPYAPQMSAALSAAADAGASGARRPAERVRRAARPGPPGRAGRRHRRTTRPRAVVPLPPGGAAAGRRPGGYDGSCGSTREACARHGKDRSFAHWWGPACRVFEAGRSRKRRGAVPLACGLWQNWDESRKSDGSMRWGHAHCAGADGLCAGRGGGEPRYRP